MNLRAKQNQIREMLNKDYGVYVNRQHFDKYLWMYSKLTTLEDVTMSEATDIIIDKPVSFAYFVMGIRANYLNQKNYTKKPYKVN